MYNQQKKLRLQIQRIDEPDQTTDLRSKRNQLLYNIKRKLKKNIETEIDRWVSEIENTQKDSRTVKMLNRQKQSNAIVHGKDGKPLLNTQDIYNEMKEHFEHHFYVDIFEGEKQLFGS